VRRPRLTRGKGTDPLGVDAAQVLIGSASGVTALMLAAWSLSVARDDASIVDIFWGFGFVVIAWIAFVLGDAESPRKWLVTLLATAWGLRLTLHLFRRNWGRGEDFRYRAMRRRNPDRFHRWTLLHVFGLQGALMLAVSLPVQMAQVQGGPGGLVIADIAGIVLVAIGISFEAVGDWQLQHFKANPANAGQVMDRGLWRYTRHPNYFGDAVVWWGLFLIAAAHPVMIWTVVSPLLMSFLLTRVSGVPLLEASMARRKPGYQEYMRRTSGFFPLPRRSRAP
jgi:steroid 5-alpha reductase family enzyme